MLRLNASWCRQSMLFYHTPKDATMKNRGSRNIGWTIGKCWRSWIFLQTSFFQKNFDRDGFESTEKFMKSSSTKCLLHNLELIVGVKLTRDNLLMHTWSSSGFFIGKEWNDMSIDDDWQSYRLRQPGATHLLGMINFRKIYVK